MSPISRYTPSTGRTMSRSISARTVSTANNGIPWAWPVTAARAVGGISGTRASTRVSIEPGSSGSRVSVVRLRPVPNPGRAWPSSGRAMTST
jgi:hypothetical protein